MVVPEAPTAPTGPGGPAGPGTVESAPGGPAGPGGPSTVEPGEPVAPVAPVEPAAPVAPVEPAEPVAPVAPVDPGLPGLPVSVLVPVPGTTTTVVAVGPGEPLFPRGPGGPRGPMGPGGPGGPGPDESWTVRIPNRAEAMRKATATSIHTDAEPSVSDMRRRCNSTAVCSASARAWARRSSQSLAPSRFAFTRAAHAEITPAIPVSTAPTANRTCPLTHVASPVHTPGSGRSGAAPWPPVDGGGSGSR